MSLDHLIVVAGLAVATVIGAWLRYRLAVQRAANTETRARVRHAHYDNLAAVYQHPRSTR